MACATGERQCSAGRVASLTPMTFTSDDDREGWGRGGGGGGGRSPPVYDPLFHTWFER